MLEELTDRRAVTSNKSEEEREDTWMNREREKEEKRKSFIVSANETQVYFLLCALFFFQTSDFTSFSLST